MEGSEMFLQWPSENHLIEHRAFVVCGILGEICAMEKKIDENFHDNKSPVKRAVNVTAH
jgi:hypothetical protein